MYFKLLSSPNRWKDSLNIGFAVLATIETALTITDIELDSFWGQCNWIIKLLLIVALFIIIVLITFICKYYISRRGISINIRGIKVEIRQGDIFSENGWKVIAFNEHFDTTVDDVIIAHNTLNGVFIDRYVNDINDLRCRIERETDDNTAYKRTNINGITKYPLGRIITYNDYMLLSFSHFTNNEAHLTQKDYEDCLRVMWIEISRTYANKPIFIPLLGSGITRFDGTPNKSKSDLLKCMLCTLRTSKAIINQPITIVLTKEAMEEINIYELK